MVYSYLFESKSIQSYLFASGKLRDLVSISERLDQLIDTNPDSVLAQVLDNLQHSHNLYDPDNTNVDILFTRCKGGAYYAWSHDQAPLLALRQLWTLTVQQLFPSLAFNDGLASGETVAQAISAGHQQLAQNQNMPKVNFPIASANVRLSTRTGKAAVKVSKSLWQRLPSEDKDKASFDADGQIHTHHYNQMLDGTAPQSLYTKFLPESARQQYQFTLDLNVDGGKFPYRPGKADIAMIHIDGNGIGQLLQSLATVLKGSNNTLYSRCFREFSELLGTATERAAQHASRLLIEDYQSENNAILPFRPLVLGGDDITILCRSDYALEYAINFCQSFEKETQQHLKNGFSQLDKKQKALLPKKLTASGGILFQKAKQPFAASHQLVEALCKQAKTLSKRMLADNSEHINNSAIAFHRIASVMGDDFQRLKTDSTQFTQSQGPAVHTALDAYVVSRQKTPGYPSITSLIGIIDELHKDNSRFKNYFRQIETELSQGNYLEAQRIMERKQRNLLEQSVSNDGVQGQIETLNKVKAHFFELSEQPSETYDWWHWMANSSQSESHKQTIITDILTAMKFKEELAHDTTQA